MASLLSTDYSQLSDEQLQALAKRTARLALVMFTAELVVMMAAGVFYVFGFVPPYIALVMGFAVLPGVVMAMLLLKRAQQANAALAERQG